MNTPNSKPILRFLFLNPPDPDGELWMKEVGRCGRKAVGGEIWPQTGLAYLAAMIEREGHEARILDGMAVKLPPEELDRKCREWPPDVIVANSATPTLNKDARVLSRLREATGALCGFAGPHVSALPEATLAETGADFGLVNEAEETVAELARALAKIAGAEGAGEAKGRGGAKSAGRPRFPGEELGGALAGIKGLVWRAGNRSDGLDGLDELVERNRIILNPARPLVTDLDALPYPARHLLPNQAYRAPFFQDHPFATIIPSRGCPWPCSFCRAGRVWGRRIRLRSVGNVLGEIALLRREFGVCHLAFMTDSLTLKREWAMELFEGLARLPEPPEWICNSRVDVVDADLLSAMKRANCRIVSYGVESGSQAILDACRKGITLEQSERAVRLTRKAGILSMAYFILGLPGETAETARATMRFARKIKPDYVNFHVATPFPGTELFEEAERRGWLTSRNWEDYEEEGSAVLQAGELTPAELKRLQAKAMRGFYLRPSRLLRELGRVRSWAAFRARARAGLRMLAVLRGK